MKTLGTLFLILLMVTSSVYAGDSQKNKKRKIKDNRAVASAPFILGSPDEPAPEELRLLKAKNALIPVAPFIWGNASEDVPVFLNSVKAKNAKVPVAPFVFANPEETDLRELNSLSGKK